MSGYTPSDMAIERGAQGVQELLNHPTMEGVKWSPETVAGVVIDYATPLIVAELREQIAESLLDDSPDGIFAAAYVRLMDPQPGDPPVRTFMRVMDIIAARIARGEWEQ